MHCAQDTCAGIRYGRCSGILSFVLVFWYLTESKTEFIKKRSTSPQYGRNRDDNKKFRVILVDNVLARMQITS